MMGYSLFTFYFIPIFVYAGYPISDPYDDLGANGKILPYNLIDSNPSCFWNGHCPMFPPGGELSAFPNSEEKFQHLLHNQHRIFVNQSLKTSLGYWVVINYTNISRSSYCEEDCNYCGSSSTSRVPLYWYSDANQMARFKQWDESTCDVSWYSQPQSTIHSTCQWGSEETITFRGTNHTTPMDRCSLLSTYPDDCSFGSREAAFCNDYPWDRWFETEGICSGNSCLNDRHCEPIFANKYDYVGTGFVGGMRGVANVYSRFTKEIFYLLPIAAHFDERMKVVPGDYNAENNHFVLMLQYHDRNGTQTPEACYALYDGEIVEMPVWLSLVSSDGYGDYNSAPGWYSIHSYSVIFKAHFPPPTSCRPYAFICKTSLGNVFRLPEDDDYYFGTEWIDWAWSDYEGDLGLHCKENHYYHHETEGWTVNGGPTLNQSDIWYYQDTLNYGYCIGCQYIDTLHCLAECVHNHDVTAACQASCPTAAPITSQPTNIPYPAINATTTTASYQTTIPMSVTSSYYTTVSITTTPSHESTIPMSVTSAYYTTTSLTTVDNTDCDDDSLNRKECRDSQDEAAKQCSILVEFGFEVCYVECYKDKRSKLWNDIKQCLCKNIFVNTAFDDNNKRCYIEKYHYGNLVDVYNIYQETTKCTLQQGFNFSTLMYATDCAYLQGVYDWGLSQGNAVSNAFEECNLLYSKSATDGYPQGFVGISSGVFRMQLRDKYGDVVDTVVEDVADEGFIHSMIHPTVMVILLFVN